MSNEVSTKVGPVAEFSGVLDKFKPQLALALPKHLDPDRMARLALTAFSSTPKLQECETRTILASLMIAGQLGLEPGVNGAGYLIPYTKSYKVGNDWHKRQECQFVPGWKGLVDLVSRSGRGTVFTGVIFRDQEYTFTDGARRDLVIHNETDLANAEDITHAYAIGWVKDAAMPIIELWRVTKIRAHRDKYNKVGEKHYSFRDWEMYARKVPLLQVLKYMPCSIEVSNAIAVNNAAEMGHSASIENGIVIDNDSGEEYEDTSGRGNQIVVPPIDEMRKKVAAAKSPADIQALRKEIAAVPAAERKEAMALAAARMEELKPPPAETKPATPPPETENPAPDEDMPL